MRGHGDAARIGQSLQPCGNVDAVAMAIVAFDDHVAEIYAHAQVDALAIAQAGVASGHAALQDDCAFDRIDDAAEFHQQAVAHQLEDAAVVLGDRWLEQLLAVRTQPFERAGLILLHEPAVADHVGGKDSGEVALHMRMPSDLGSGEVQILGRELINAMSTRPSVPNLKFASYGVSSCLANFKFEKHTRINFF